MVDESRIVQIPGWLFYASILFSSWCWPIVFVLNVILELLGVRL